MDHQSPVPLYKNHIGMKTNMGKIDKVLRILFAIVVAILYSAEVLTGVLGLTLLVIAIAFVVTSFVGFCPVYAAFGLSTLKKKTGRTT